MEKIADTALLKAKIETSDNIMLVGHVNPDGDSIGSLAGMKAYLASLNKNVTAVVPNKFPGFLRFLDSNSEILEYSEYPLQVEQAAENAQLIICMDFNSLGRIDALGEVVRSSNAYKVLIDHHPNPDGIFDLIYSYPHLSSTCELVYWILKELMESAEFPLGGAVALYTGMMTDTNNFANSVLPSTFIMAGELMEAGVDKEYVQRMVFGGYSEERMRLMGYMLESNLKMVPQYNAAVMVLTREIKEKFNFKDGDSEGFVNLALNIKSVNVSALFTEGDDFVRVSLRSKDNFSVNSLARAYFNGGGHERAAGGRLFMPVADVEEYFVKSLGEYIAGGVK